MPRHLSDHVLEAARGAFAWACGRSWLGGDVAAAEDIPSGHCPAVRNRGVDCRATSVRPGTPAGGPRVVVVVVASRLELAVLAQPARPMTSHMKPTPKTVQTRVRRLGWWAWASGKIGREHV